MAAKIVTALLALLSGSRVAHADAQFRPGQKWGYHTRPGDEGSTLIILKIEELPKLGVVVHIAVDGARFRSRNGASTPIGHLSFARAAVAASVTKLLADKVSIPDFADGYARWKADHGGIWAGSVAETIAALDAAASGAAR